MNFESRLISLLRSFGLNQTEARCYLEISEKPGLSMNELIRNLRLAKTTAYRVCEHLHELGFISYSTSDWRRRIQPVSLKNLARKVGRRQRRLRQVELELKSLSNLLDLSPHFVSKDPVEIITDPNLIKEKSDEIVTRPWDHFLCYGSAERLIDVIGEADENRFVRKRYTSGKACSAILTEVGDYTHEILPRNRDQLRDMYIDIDEDNQDYCTYVYDQEVTIWHKDPELGHRALVIRDPAIVQMQANMFHALWRQHC